MTTNIFSVLNTAKLGLLSHQMAIEVTGQNIANAQTAGYSRQEVSFEATTPRQIGIGMLGTGVRVSGIKRAHDQFLYTQILSEQKTLGRNTINKNGFDRLEALFSEQGAGNVNSSLSDFFGGLQDLSTNPTGLPERSTVLSNGENLVQVFNRMGSSLFKTQQDLNQNVDTQIADINSLTEQIAQLNKNIHGSEPGPIQANDLRDQRDKLIRELSQKIDVTYVEESNGEVSLTLQNGRPLVLRESAFKLSSGLNGNNRGFKDVFLDNGAGAQINITSEIKDGELRGTLDMRDVVLAGFKDRLDRLAAGIVREVNRAHQAGISLDGQRGLNFFNPLTPTVVANTNNTGTASVSVANASPLTASVDKYEMAFTGANTFTLNNLTTGFASGSFTFVAGTSFNLANGLAVTITGSGVSGDRVRFSLSEDAASLMRVADDVKGNPVRIAAGKTSVSDGANATDLAQLENTLSFNSTTLTSSGSGSFTFGEYYASLIGDVGVNSKASQNHLAQQEGIMLQLNTRREGSSGVSLDEEMLNLIKFQQAYAASARMISAASQMFEVLQNKI
jgi:flagellar hook-associated protein 1 FlgK